jgi:hypothetical protein
MDVMTLGHDELVELVLTQQATIAALEATIARLEQRIRDLEGGTTPPRRLRHGCHDHTLHQATLVRVGVRPRAYARVRGSCHLVSAQAPAHAYALSVVAYPGA